jgi:AcrR family transcriptional regulator
VTDSLEPRRSGKRTKQPTLRERQHEATRNLILDALVDQLAETGAFDYSAFELARRANVSVRTIYRHFPDRDALLAAMSTRVNERIGLYNLPTETGKLPETARILFRKFDENPQLVMAQITTSAGGQVRSAGRKDRIARVRQGIDALAPELDAATRQARTAVLACLLSANTWHRMRDEFGMTGADSGEALAWAIERIQEAIVEENRKAKARKGKEGR